MNARVFVCGGGGNMFVNFDYCVYIVELMAGGWLVKTKRRLFDFLV